MSDSLKPTVSASSFFMTESSNWHQEEVVRKAMTPTAEDKADSGAAEWVEPYLPLEGLKTLARNSTIIPQCITAYGDNIAGFGLMLEYIEDVNEESPEMKAEWDKAQRVIDMLNPDGVASEVFKEAINERERCGIGYIECIRDVEGNVVEVYSLHDSDTIRKSKLQEVSTDYTFFYKGEQINRKKRFRRYKQEANGRTVYFKEFGDPRMMDRRTGNYVTNESEVPPIEYQANELLELKIGPEHYGEVRWVGQIVSVDGSSAAEALNDNYFHNGRHTPMMILVNDGQLTKEAKDEITTYLASVRGEKSQFGFLLLEAEAKETNTALEEKPKPTVEIKDLSPMLQKDALFCQYLDDNRKKLQSAFRLPDVYVAYTTDYNRATVISAMQLTEEQVFRPERKTLEWVINNKLLNSYGFRHVRVAVKSPDLTDEDALNARLSTLGQFGGLTMNMAKELVHQAVGRENCEPYNDTWGNYPISLFNAMLDNTPADQNQPSTDDVIDQPGQEDAEPEGADVSKSEHTDELIAVLKSVRRVMKAYAEKG